MITFKHWLQIQVQDGRKDRVGNFARLTSCLDWPKNHDDCCHFAGKALDTKSFIDDFWLCMREYEHHVIKQDPQILI